MTETIALAERPAIDTQAQPLHAVVSCKALRAALKSANFAGVEYDATGTRTDGFITLVPDEQRGRLLVRAQGNGATITAVAPCESIAGSTTTVERKRFSDLVYVTESDTLTLKGTNREIAVFTRGGRFRFRVRNEAVEQAETDANAAVLELPVATFRDAMRRVRHAMAKNDVRHCLNALCMEVRTGELRMVASDSIRLAIEKIPMPGIDAQRSYLLLDRSVESINSLVSGYDGDVRIGRSERSVWVSLRAENGYPTAHLTAPLMAERFVDYEKVLPQNVGNNYWIGPASEFRRAVEHAQVIDRGRDGISAATFSATSEATILECGSAGEGRLELNLDRHSVDEAPISIALGTRFLSDSLSALHRCNQIKMSVYNLSAKVPSGVIITSEDAPGFMVQIVEIRR